MLQTTLKDFRWLNIFLLEKDERSRFSALQSRREWSSRVVLLPADHLTATGEATKDDAIRFGSLHGWCSTWNAFAA